MPFGKSLIFLLILYCHHKKICILNKYKQPTHVDKKRGNSSVYYKNIQINGGKQIKTKKK
jgi:hypothetical protein